MISIAFTIFGCVFTLLLIMVYFTKKRVNMIENKMYSVLIIISFFSSLIEIINYCLVIKGISANSPIYSFFIKLLFLMFLIWLFSFSIYFVLLGRRYSQKNVENVLKIIPIMVFVSLITLILPIKIDEVNGLLLPSGIGVNTIYFLAAICIICIIVSIIINRKYIKNKEYIPIYILIVIFSLVILFQRLNPELLLINPALSFLTFVMYFTIENPDVKMIQQLEVAREQAEKANRAKTDFLSSMSHEIRTPLNAIVGFSDCIMDAESLGEAKENAKDIVNASQTLLEIVNGILDISKIEAGKLEIVNSKYNAFETFEELAKLITPKMKEKGLDFTYSIAPDLPKTLFGDHANIKKIVTNLLSNACKYTERGFVHYEVNCVNSKGVTKLIISVEDSGRGIKKESIDKMFTKFQRLDEDRNTTIEGTGLGLAITKQLIELMGGRIIVHTVYGEGSKFTVVLNQKIETEDVVDKKKVSSTLDLHDVRIMMVDDTALNLKVGCKLLEKYNANHIVTCSNGFECLERIQRGEIYDLILLDDMMPKMSGVETLKKLKEIPGFKVPTIALTANAITGMREKYLADGFDDYLAKPIEKDQLIQVVNQVLGRSVTEEINVVEDRVIPDQVIRGEEIPNMDDVERAETSRENNTGIIPVEENVEETLGKTIERNYKQEIEQLETVNPVEELDLIPVVDINVNPSDEKVDRSYLESHGVDVNHALELLGDMDMYNMTISDFMKEVEEKWNKIVEYKNSNNMPDYAIEVHSLKSDCKYLGFMDLAEIAYQHELKSKENDSEFVNTHFAELEDNYKKVLEIAKEYVQHNPVEK